MFAVNEIIVELPKKCKWTSTLRRVMVVPVIVLLTYFQPASAEKNSFPECTKNIREMCSSITNDYSFISEAKLYPDGLIYADGFGILKRKNGEIYIGNLKKNEYINNGVLFKADGTIRLNSQKNKIKYYPILYSKMLKSWLDLKIEQKILISNKLKVLGLWSNDQLHLPTKDLVVSLLSYQLINAKRVSIGTSDWQKILNQILEPTQISLAVKALDPLEKKYFKYPKNLIIKLKNTEYDPFNCSLKAIFFHTRDLKKNILESATFYFTQQENSLIAEIPSKIADAHQVNPVYFQIIKNHRESECKPVHHSPKKLFNQKSTYNKQLDVIDINDVAIVKNSKDLIVILDFRVEKKQGGFFNLTNQENQTIWTDDRQFKTLLYMLLPQLVHQFSDGDYEKILVSSQIDEGFKILFYQDILTQYSQEKIFEILDTASFSLPYSHIRDYSGLIESHIGNLLRENKNFGIILTDKPNSTCFFEEVSEAKAVIFFKLSTNKSKIKTSKCNILDNNNNQNNWNISVGNIDDKNKKSVFVDFKKVVYDVRIHSLK